MIWQPEFTDKTLSRKPGAVQGMLKTAAFVVPAAGVVGGAAKAYESPVIRNALLRLANTPKGSTAYDRAISTVTQSLTRVAQASQKEAQ
ncbi:hypothetical protein BFQ11_26460 [Escherichia coli]|nr:hypothetical protein BFQ11_26460 [Escherichia coli]